MACPPSPVMANWAAVGVRTGNRRTPVPVTDTVPVPSIETVPDPVTGRVMLPNWRSATLTMVTGLITVTTTAPLIELEPPELGLDAVTSRLAVADPVVAEASLPEIEIV